MSQPSEFTQKAMQMAREQDERERIADAHSSHTAFEREEEKHTVHLFLSDSDLKQLYRLMDLGISKSREAITRCQRFPTDSIRSSMTIERHEKTIDHIEQLRSHLNEEAQW